MTSQKYIFFEIMGYDVIFLQRVFKGALTPKLSSELQFPTEIKGIKV